MPEGATIPTTDGSSTSMDIDALPPKWNWEKGPAYSPCPSFMDHRYPPPEYPPSMSYMSSPLSQMAHAQPPPPRHAMFNGLRLGGHHIPILVPEMPMFEHSDMLDDAAEAKRRRIARACDTCRRKKIKCDGRQPACGHCLTYRTDCVFTPVEKKRTIQKGARYVKALENRLQRMENIAKYARKLADLEGEDEDGEIDLGALESALAEKYDGLHQGSRAGSPHGSSSAHPQATSTRRSSLASPGPESDQASEKEEEVSGSEVEELREMMGSLVTNESGETQYFGSSSGFSILSPKGIQWVKEKTGDDPFEMMISDGSIGDNRWTDWKPEVFGDLFRRPVFRPLPPKAEAVSLLKDYFGNFNCMFPLFHQPTFMHLVERQYSGEPYETTGWWASLNCCLAFGHRLRVMSDLVPQEEDEKAWGYLKNAMACFPELAMRSTDLFSVQALLAMALFLQGTPNSNPSFVLVSTAIRLAHSIGLHTRGAGFNLDAIEIEQRKRVFWIAYMLDKDACLRSGRPPAQDDDDMNVELPDADPEDNIGNIPLPNGKGKMNLFRAMCEIAQIESKVYRRLYSTKAAKQSCGELLYTICNLDEELEAWRNRIPIDFRPDHEIRASHTPLILHVVMLHMTYHNCLTTIHRMSVRGGYWTSRLADFAKKGRNTKPLNPRVFSSAYITTAAARTTVSLLEYIPKGDLSIVWLVLYFPVAALMTLFSNILQNPMDRRATSDSKLMEVVVTFLSRLGQEAETGGVHRMLGICTEFLRVAKAAIAKADKDLSFTRRKRRSCSPTAPTAAAAAAAGTEHQPAASPQRRRPTSATMTAVGNGVNSVNREYLSPQFNAEANRQRNQFNSPVVTNGVPEPRPATATGTATATEPSIWQLRQVPQELIEPLDLRDWADASTGRGYTAQRMQPAPAPDVEMGMGIGPGPATGTGMGMGMGMGMGTGMGGMGMGMGTGMGTGMGGMGIDTGMGSPVPAPMNGQWMPNSVQPQDSYSHPTTNDWNWAETNGEGYPSV
ncbi:hypothetical protein SODALDRAFT_332682 [Sodiomyces alkalinus F11]|uniref:Zn(2)-C6 fungal-type domain-containing protein n=1 Tax=Sodiomyces alkalinus (strain CBS 110278 / VKM F-3762 / F11) TaxID=1314773 RepID=A0A3N2PXP7_SODAK|nr:hypothetical protein SODALDRAFT_332682 [Sodiomyces alkalinus F11]ROT39244.1 hypothetical protein SODALDRAFT_332682 [Sodiomyces alkalinus F11]